MIVFRKSTEYFHSIENVFNVLLPYLKLEKVELPYESKGVVNRLKNIWFLIRRKVCGLHITGHDHYLLWYPFKNAILTIHDVEALKRKKGIKRWLFKKLWFDWPIKNAKVLTTISEFSKKEILSLGNYQTPIQVIYNPLTLPLEYTPKKFNKAKPRILHIGTKANKNLDRLIEALGSLSCELVIVGRKNNRLLNRLAKSGIDYVFKTNLSNEEMIEEYKACDILAFVSTYEGFGLPIIEAQAVGRPVITSNIASMPEVAGEGALLVNPYSIEEIQEGINKLILDDGFREELIRKGRINIKRFNVKSIANDYIKLYNSLN